MSADWYQKREWKKNRNGIIRLLMKKPLSFAEVICESGLSRGVVNCHLNELVSDGIVEKKYVEGKLLNLLKLDGLPAATRERLKPIVFSATVEQYVAGLNAQVTHCEGKKPEVVVRPEAVSIRENLAFIVQRLGLFYLLSYLESIERNNLEWFENVTKLDFTMIFDSVFFQERKGEFLFPIVFDTDGLKKVELFREAHRFQNPNSRKSTVNDGHPTYNEAKRLKELLKEFYPKEMEKFETAMS
jgi:hypothetical protein